MQASLVLREHKHINPMGEGGNDDRGDFKKEHEEIALMLAILEKICAQLEVKKNVDQTNLEGIIEFFMIFVDPCHHGKEEDLLFPAVRPMEGKFLGTLLGEHSQGRSYVRIMTKATIQIKKGCTCVQEEYAARVQKYIALMYRPIEKENDVLFPLLDRLLGKKRQRELVDGFEKLENKTIVAGIHEKFHKLLSELRENYLD